MIFELSEIIKLILNTARNTFTVIYILEKRFFYCGKSPCRYFFAGFAIILIL